MAVNRLITMVPDASVINFFGVIYTSSGTTLVETCGNMPIVA
jgi:hypothetical protein